MNKAHVYLLLVTLVCLIPTALAQEPKKEPAVTFKRYLGIHSKNSPEQLVLMDAKLRQLGDRNFLVGTPVMVEENASKLTPKKDVVWWIALSEVTEFYEFQDVKGYRFEGK